MKKILFLTLMGSLLVGCTQDTHVDEGYYHIPKHEVVCVEQSRRELRMGKSTDLQVQAELRCIFLMKESFIVDPIQEAKQARLKTLLKEGVPDANTP